MEMLHGFKYSEVKQENNVDVGVSRRLWRSVKRVAGRFTTRRPPRWKSVAAVVVRRVALWASVQLKKRMACRISDAARSRRRSNDNIGQPVILNYDVFNYSKNFDDGKWQQEEVDFYGRRSFSYRFVDTHVDQDSILI